METTATISNEVGNTRNNNNNGLKIWVPKDNLKIEWGRIYYPDGKWVKFNFSRSKDGGLTMYVDCAYDNQLVSFLEGFNFNRVFKNHVPPIGWNGRIIFSNN